MAEGTTSFQESNFLACEISKLQGSAKAYADKIGRFSMSPLHGLIPLKILLLPEGSVSRRAVVNQSRPESKNQDPVK